MATNADHYSARIAIYSNKDNVFCPGKTVSLYTEDYDKETRGLGYRIYKELVDVALSLGGKLNNDACILDIGAGTGVVGETLRNVGFGGVIDALDGSEVMLKVANSKDIAYRETVKHFLTIDNPMPFADESYDAIIGCGALAVANITPDCLPDFVRVCKTGGLIAFTCMSGKVSESHQIFETELKRVIKEMATRGVWEVLEMDRMADYFGPDTMEQKDATPKLQGQRKNTQGTIYCMRKL